MDTKTFYDALLEANVNVRDEDSGDGFAVAMELVMGGDPDSIELHLDWLGEAILGRDQSEHDKTMQKRLHSNLGRAFQDAEHLSTIRQAGPMFTTYSSSFIHRLTEVGEAVYNIILPKAEKYVEEYLDEWWADMHSYAGDMEAGARDDWEFERYRDRMMEERD